MQIMLNGSLIQPPTMPLNKPFVLFYRQPQKQTEPDAIASVRLPAFDEGRKAWFVKADSDFVPYNVPDERHPFSWRAFYNPVALIDSNFTDAPYTYLFSVGKMLKPGSNKLRITNLHETERMRFEYLMLIAKDKNYLIFSRDYMEYIHPWTTPRPEDLKETIEATLCRDEYEPIQFAIFNAGEEPLRDVVARISELEGEAGKIPKQDLDLRMVRCYRAERRKDIFQPQIFDFAPKEMRNLLPEILTRRELFYRCSRDDTTTMAHRQGTRRFKARHLSWQAEHQGP
ncbi:MAG TPA: hypothetical protein EYP19_00030 [Desulfobacterales bacterium]|nr:hypothetical protein [Desulfobacterales bacterium]